MSPTRVCRVLCAGAAGVLLILGAAGITLAPAARADTDPSIGRPSTFAGVASAAGVFETVDRRLGLAAVPQAVYGRLPDGYSSFGDQLSSVTARASVFYPGSAVVGLGSLLCTAAGSGTPPCNLPPYPLYTSANENRPDARVASPTGMGGGVLGIGAANADAHVRSYQDLVPTGTSTNAVVTNLDEPSTGGAVVHLGSVEAHTAQSFEKTSTLVVTSVAKASGIDLLGGMIHIDSVTATSTLRDDGLHPPTRSEDLVVGGVTANGHAATIDSNGITVDGSGQGKPALDAANKALQHALAGEGVAIRTIGHSAPVLEPTLCPKGEVDGVQVQLTANVNIPVNLPSAVQQLLPTVPVPGLGPVGVPTPGEVSDVYFANIILGAACTDAFASPDRVTLSTGGGSSPLPGVGVAVPVSGGGSFSSPAGLSTPANPSSGPSSATSPVPSSVAREPVRSAVVRSELAGVSRWVSLTALLLSLPLLLVAVGVRPFVPARLPAGR